MRHEYGEAAGNPGDRCMYKRCPKKGVVKAGDYMVDVGSMIENYRFHASCYHTLKRRRR